MTSSRPYLIRALYEWIVDNSCTPHLVVDAGVEGVEVPERFVQDGQIVLNVSPRAVRDLSLDNDLIGFSARFAGQSMDIRVPPRAVLAVYARENGKGMVFPSEDDGEGGGDGGPELPPQGPGKPKLRVVR